MEKIAYTRSRCPVHCRASESSGYLAVALLPPLFRRPAFAAGSEGSGIHIPLRHAFCVFLRPPVGILADRELAEVASRQDLKRRRNLLLEIELGTIRR